MWYLYLQICLLLPSQRLSILSSNNLLISAGLEEGQPPIMVSGSKIWGSGSLTNQPYCIWTHLYPTLPEASGATNSWVLEGSVMEIRLLLSFPHSQLRSLCGHWPLKYRLPTSNFHFCFSPVLIVLMGLYLKKLYCGFSGIIGWSKSNICVHSLTFTGNPLSSVLQEWWGWEKGKYFREWPWIHTLFCGRRVPGTCLHSWSWKWPEVTWLDSIFLGRASEGR